MNVTGLYLIVAAIGIVLALIAYLRNRNNVGGIIIGFSLMEIVIMAVIGVINGVLGTPNAMLGRLFMTFSGSYGFLAFAAICGGFHIFGPACGDITRQRGRTPRSPRCSAQAACPRPGARRRAARHGACLCRSTGPDAKLRGLSPRRL